MTLSTIKAALLFALRESRFALRNFKIFIASLFLGTAIIAGVGSVTATISNSIKQDGRIFLGGDVEINQIQKRLTDEERGYISQRGTLSEVATLRTMAHKAEDSSLVDLKAVDAVYPLYGAFLVQGISYSPTLLKNNGIVISNALSTRLSVKIGDRLRLGTKVYQVRGLIQKEPDANNQGFQLAPGAIISLDSLFENSLVKPGSLVRYYNRVKLSPDITLKGFKDNLKEAFPDQAWQVRDDSSGGAGLRNFIGRMGQFMTLVGLTALLVGGVGVSNAVRSYLDGKTDTIATYKILGGTSQTILIAYLGQILLIALVTVLVGLLAGAILPLAAGSLLKDSMPVDFALTLHPKPLILAAFYSLSVALIFTLWPLGKAVQTPAARLFRQTVSVRRSAKQSFAYQLVIAGLVLCRTFVVIYVSEFRQLTAATLAASAAAFLILMGASVLVQKLAKSLPRSKNPIFRIAISNIYRPGNSTSSIILSLGLGLILFTSISLIESNLLREINDRVNGEAPSFFFIDIQKDQHDKFTQFLDMREGVETYRTVPNLRGRVTHIKSIEATKAEVAPDGRWILRGDKGITFTPDLPKDNDIISGEWWPEDYAGQPEVSISEQMAVSMGLMVGDSIAVNILGRSFTLPIASIRRFSWESFGINYVMMMDPHTLKSAPFTYVATAKVTPTDESQIFRELSKQFPGLSIIRMTDVLKTAITLLAKISGAIDVMAAITIIAGVIVLAGAIAAGHKARIYDAAVLKVVGATRWDILKAYVIEFILLGMITGLIALVLGSLAAYCVINFVMEMSWVLPIGTPLLTVTSSSLATLLFGMVSIWVALSARPTHVLRNHGL